MCADNGVVAEGVTQTGQEVTAIVAENFTKKETSVCLMSEVAGVEAVPGGYRDGYGRASGHQTGNTRWHTGRRI